MGLIKTSLMSESYAVLLSVAVSALIAGVWLLDPSALPSKILWVPLLFAWAGVQRKVAAGPSCFFFEKKRRSRELLFDAAHVAVVTGANSGIGYYTALRLAEMGSTVVITCRTNELIDSTIGNMEKEFAATRRAKYAAAGIATVSELRIVRGYTLELDNKKSIEAFAAKFKSSGMKLNILVNNAGMMVRPLQFSKQNEKLELHTAVNFLGPLMLTELLLPIIKQSGGRIVNVASEAHRMPEMLPGKPSNGQYILDALKQVNQGAGGAQGPLATLSVANAFGRYGVSKLCNIYHAHAIATMHRGVPVCSLHPGTVATGFTRGLLFAWFKRIFDVISLCYLKTNEEGAETTLYCCIADVKELAPVVDPKDKNILLAPYFVDCANSTRRLLRPIGWDGNGALAIVNWGLDTMGLSGGVKKGI
jgi:NAD(P)-dependent dehydrogenase (short-subunit alcohol dehydrogenase family)